MMVTRADNQLDEVYSSVESNYRDGKYVMTVDINQSDRKRVSQASVNAITRGGDPNQHRIVDNGVVLDTGAALTITPTGDQRIINDTIRSIANEFDIKGVGGDPITIKQKCSMYLNYTDEHGQQRTFKLKNCYLCDNIRTPLVCATHLVNQGFEIHLTKQGHNMVFPDRSISTLTTQSNGLIALLPVPLAMLTQKKSLSSSQHSLLSQHKRLLLPGFNRTPMVSP